MTEGKGGKIELIFVLSTPNAAASNLLVEANLTQNRPFVSKWFIPFNIRVTLNLLTFPFGTNLKINCLFLFRFRLSFCNFVQVFFYLFSSGY